MTRYVSVESIGSIIAVLDSNMDFDMIESQSEVVGGDRWSGSKRSQTWEVTISGKTALNAVRRK